MKRKIEIEPRFRRSVRIDTDYNSPIALDGFCCTVSYQQAIKFVAKHVRETGQAAFTWTGPYGCGKSSLGLAFACLTGAKKPLRDKASEIFDDSTLSDLKSALPYFPSRWDVLPIVAEKRSVTKQLAEALRIRGRHTANAVLRELESLTAKRGLLLFIDELGRGLEAAAEGDGDIHILQDIAELSTRSGGKLVLIGILHQSFDEYAERLGKTLRSSWAKIQGRFVDISISVSLEENIELISIALGQKYGKSILGPTADATANLIQPNRAKASRTQLAMRLKRCYPLHPLVSCLLGPLSRSRFGQNQRSVFSFLNSSEPCGLQDTDSFVHDGNNIYRTYHLWDYVKANFEGSVLSSNDGRRWSTALDAIERCTARGGTDIEIKVLKTIGIFELLKDKSGLPTTEESLEIAFSGEFEPKQIEQVLVGLQNHSEIVFRKHVGQYVLYAGSDFDIDQSVSEIVARKDFSSIRLIQSLADIPPLLAKRHYENTGAMRWFSLSVVSVEQVNETEPPTCNNDIVGKVLIVVPSRNETKIEATDKINKLLANETDSALIVGFSPISSDLVELGDELAAIQQLDSLYPELRGDPIARREIEVRSAGLKQKIEETIQILLDDSEWFTHNEEPIRLTKRQFNEKLSRLCDLKFRNSPRIHNEMLNCTRPSSSAISARTKLMKRMTRNMTIEDIGFNDNKFPAERGLFESVIKSKHLFDNTQHYSKFIVPTNENEYNLYHLWREADELLDTAPHTQVTAKAIIDKWTSPPIGLKSGLAPVFIITYALSKFDSVAVYGEGVFQSSFSELCVEYLARNPADVSLRRIELKGVTKGILEKLSQFLNLTQQNEPLSVAREIVAHFDELVPWTMRTQSLSPTTMKVRDILKRAKDPNKLLFEDFPSLAVRKNSSKVDPTQIACIVRDSIAELKAAYPKILGELRTLLHKELGLKNSSAKALKSLRIRADNIRDIGGDLRMDAFINRLGGYYGTDENIEGIASIAANKLPKDWNDTDQRKTVVELTTFCKNFLNLEAIAHVRGRKSKRQALAVVVGRDDTPLQLMEEFQIADTDKKEINLTANALNNTLKNLKHDRREIILAALVEVTSRYLNSEHKV